MRAGGDENCCRRRRSFLLVGGRRQAIQETMASWQLAARASYVGPGPLFGRVGKSAGGLAMGNPRGAGTRVRRLRARAGASEWPGLAQFRS